MNQATLRNRVINLARSDFPIVRQDRSSEPSDLNRMARYNLIWRFIGAIGHQQEEDIDAPSVTNFTQHFGLSGLVGLEAYVKAVADDLTISNQFLRYKLELYVDILIASAESRRQRQADYQLARQYGVQAPCVA